MLTNFFTNFFDPISLTFLGLLFGAAIIGLGVGFWIWGTLSKRLAARYERINKELAVAHRKNSSASPNDLNELDRVRKYARLVEEERNRLLVDNNLYQKQTETLRDLEKEQNLLSQELLDLKTKQDRYENAEITTWKAENRRLRGEVAYLESVNETLQNDLDTQLDYLKNQLLHEIDIQDSLEVSLHQIRIDFAQITQERNDWKTRYEDEHTRTHRSINETKGNFQENTETGDAPLQTAVKQAKNETEKNGKNDDDDDDDNDVLFINDARTGKATVTTTVTKMTVKTIAAAKKQDVRQLLEDRWLTTSPEDRDILQRIVGIGPVLEQRLNDLGIYSFEQLGRLDDFLIEKVAEALDCPPQRIINDNWVGQAKILATK
ncbi:MAG: hypothetical protein RI894_2377 [Bacteroidota bacterium]|jgi:predicted flap endonuclease-1-like 5' DNA nuclease